MKKLDWTAVTASNGLVFEEQTFEHVNNGHKDSYIAFVKANIPSAWHTGKLVVLYGCVATGTNPSARTLTSGAVYYNGEIYQVDSASFTTTGSQIGIWTLVDVDSGSTESTIKTSTSSFLSHVLVNSKFMFAAGESGSGTFDESSSNVVRISSKVNTLVAGTDTTYSGTAAFATITGCTYTTPPDNITRKYLITFKCTAEIVVATGGGVGDMNYRLYDLTNATVLDTSRFSFSIPNGGSSRANIILTAIADIVPSVNIVVQSEVSIQTNLDFFSNSQNKIEIIELERLS